MPGPEATILVAASNLLRTEAVKRLERARRVLADPEVLPEEALARIGHDLAIAVAAHKAASGIDDVMGELAAEELTG